MNFKTHFTKKEKSSDAALAMDAALRFLSRREYSKLELYSKLSARYTPDASKKTIEQCVEKGWLSEERYTEMLHRHIVNQCYGPMKFILEAKKKGITSSLYSEYLENTDWKTVAINYLNKKISKDDHLTYEEKQKILASLARRGFSNSICIRAFEEFFNITIDL